MRQQAQDQGRKGWLTPISVAIGVCTLLALALRLLLLSRPGYLLGVTEYDDGPYFGSAVNLIHGYLPYRSFLLVQPPGITLLMVPSALLSEAIGTAHAMATGRILTTLASSAGVVLVGLLLRHRGLLAVIVGCGIVAVYPDSVSTARTVLVEPWLVLFCLLGALALFDGNRLTSSRKRLLWSGVAFGFAGCIEVWAIFPVLVILVMLLPADQAAGRVRGRGWRSASWSRPSRSPRWRPSASTRACTSPRSPRGPGRPGSRCPPG